EVVLESELVLHIVDASAPNPEAQMATVREVLGEIQAGEIDELLVFNKADLNPEEADRLVRANPGSVAVSAKTGEGIEALLEALGAYLRANSRVVELEIPFSRGDVLAAVHREGEVLHEEHNDHGTRVQVRVDAAGSARFENWVVSA
ncbi:MAG: GTPase HflX, partial [Actinobacteria bacterium]|nr:GTPase HflX [Actinomycetota bacterium]